MAQTLNKTRIAQLQNRLRQRYAALLDEVREELLRTREDSYINLAGRVHDPGEESVAGLIADLEIEGVVRHCDEIYAIEGAFDRLAHGTYGICSSCGETIDVARLEAEPTATLCSACAPSYQLPKRSL
jgi:RNA polymerase-binding transcription factor DksA